MYKTLLVSRVNPQDFTGIKKKVFFLIGDMNNPEIENKLARVIRESEFFDVQDTVYKYNGVELTIEVQKIPQVIKLLSKEDFSIFSVYEVYSPDL